MTIKKRHVLETALFLFHQEGFSNVGVDRIIAESKIAKMTFYKNFPSKIQLIEACLREESLQIQAAIHEKLARCKTHEPLEKLKAIYNWHHALIHSEGFNGDLFHKAASTFLQQDSEVFAIIDQHKTWQFKLIKAQLLQLQIRQPDTLASLLVNLLDGMLCNAKHDLISSGGVAHDLWQLFEHCLIQQKISLSA